MNFMSQFELNAGASSGADAGAGTEAANAAAGAETPGEVRLRRPERRQMELAQRISDRNTLSFKSSIR
jgi:hypothetical protein